MARKKLKVQKYKNEDTYELTEEQLDVEGSRGFVNHNMSRHTPHESSKVINGSWIMVTRTLPIQEHVRPKTYSIYWATPCKESKSNDGFDKFGRYKVDIHVVNTINGNLERVCLFPEEYSVVTQERLSTYIQEGWTVQHTDYKDENLNLELLEQSRTLTEEEREVIMAYQVDGLTESQACEQYFKGRFLDYSGKTIYYEMPEEYREEIEGVFGKR